MGETCKIADAEAAFSWGEVEGFFLEPSQRASFQGENVIRGAISFTEEHRFSNLIINPNVLS